jgi:hypothetical protein
MKAENTQLYALKPPSCATIVGMAVATIVDSVEDMNKLSIRPAVMTTKRLRDIH